MLPSNWFENSACKGCSYGERITGGVFCYELQGLVPCGYQGCKAQNDYCDEMYKKEKGITLAELACELRKIFIFKYLTVEFSNYNGYFVTWDEKPNWDGRYWCDEDGAVLSNAVFSFAGVDIVWEIDLSEYKDKAGEIDYSRCIVEVE